MTCVIRKHAPQAKQIWATRHPMILSAQSTSLRVWFAAVRGSTAMQARHIAWHPATQPPEMMEVRWGDSHARTRPLLAGGRTDRLLACWRRRLLY